MNTAMIDFAGTLICALVLPVGWLEYRLLEKSRWGMLLGLANVGLLYGPWVVLSWASFARPGFSSGAFLGIAQLAVATGLFAIAAPRILRVPGQARTRPETLVVTGPYRIMRHPLYAGHALCIGGGLLVAGQPLLFLMTPILWIVAAIASRYEEVTRLEPRFGDEYRRYRASCPFLLPIYGWILLGAVYLWAAVTVLRPTGLLE